MKFSVILSAVLLSLLVTLVMVTGPGCANIIPPQGGPRDSIPPVLIKATPGDSTRNFTGSRISFTFDEFVELQNVQENLMVSPSPKTNPVVDYKLNTVTVRLKDQLDSNTTYTLNFGNAIKDFNEGNPLKDFTYTFSTGKYIDSLELKGSVIMAETGKIDTTLLLILHTNPDDSAVIKDSPRYVTKQDNKGNFIFKNLPPRTFYLYALKDEGGTKRYFSDKQIFAFADKPVIVNGKTEPVTLYAYSVHENNNAPGFNIPKLATGNNKTGKNNNTVERLKYQSSISGNQDLLSEFTISFEQPLRSFDPSKIRLYTDSTFIADTSYSFIKDSTSRKIILKNKWKENTSYHVILEKDFADDSLGRKLLKTDTISFKTKKLSEYGSLKLKIRNIDMKKNPVLLVVAGENVIRTVPLSTPEFSDPMMVPGEYEIRILFDDNKNGKWDPGQFFGKHKQPEIVKPVERKIQVKPAWENDFEISL